MKAWALRNKKTGLYLPWSRNKRGNSRVEFKSQVPRLFTTKGSAKNCFTAWKQGYWSCASDGTSEVGFAHTDDMRNLIVRRNQEPVEIVEYELVEKEPIEPHSTTP